MKTWLEECLKMISNIINLFKSKETKYITDVVTNMDNKTQVNKSEVVITQETEIEELESQDVTIQGIISEERFNKLYPRAKLGTYKSLVKNLPKYDINTPERVFGFISQCGHESGSFSITSENLNYSISALNSVFPKYFKNAGRDAADYARNPEKIANIVYANRMGNNRSGDGWKYRGRGFIQLTGRDNYLAFQNEIITKLDSKIDILSNPEYVSEDVELCLLSALWYWDSRNINRHADNRDVRGMTKAINGGFNGLEDRQKRYNELFNT